MDKSLTRDSLFNKILVYLPVKDLLRFKSVCQSWCSIIDEPDFINAHRVIFENFSREIKLFQIVYQLYPNEGLRSWCYAGSPGQELIHPGFPVTNTKPCTYYLVGSCSGLICYLTNFLHGKQEINLWNPSMRKCRTLPDSSLSIERQRHFPSFGFGFDGTKDHKLVKLTYIDERLKNEKKQWSEVEIYSLNQDSWKTIGDCFPSQYYYVRGDTVFFNGCIHWITERPLGKIRPRRLPVLSFNVAKEVFQEFWLPDPHEREANCISPLRGSLSVCAKSSSSVDNCTLDIEVWLMKEYGVEESWSKLYVIRLDEELSGPIIPLRVLDGGDAEAIVYINKNVFLYYPESIEYEDFGIWANGIGVPYVTYFIETLIWVEPVIVESSSTQTEQENTIAKMEIETEAQLQKMTTTRKDNKDVGAKQENCVIL